MEEYAEHDIQRIPAHVEADQGDWEVLNVLTRIDCIDPEKSIIQYYPPNHAENPSKPRGVVRLVLDAQRIGDHHVFRPKDWEIALIVSERVRNALKKAKVSGIEFRPVTE